MTETPVAWQTCPYCQRECYAWRETCLNCGTMMPHARPKECDAAELLVMLRGLVDCAPSMRAWCRATGLNIGQVSEVLAGKRKITGPIANALGYGQIVRYRRHAN